MKRLIRSVACVAAALLCAGCYPEEAVWWSPDGRTAAVRTPDGLCLTGTDGQLSSPVLTGGVHSAAWLADGSGLIVSRSVETPNWNAAESLVPADEAESTRRLARSVPDVVKAVLTAADGSLDDVEEKFLKPLGVEMSSQLEPVWKCALALHRKEILAAIGGFASAAELQKQVLDEPLSFPVHEVLVLPVRDGRPNGEIRSLARSLFDLTAVTVSPKQPALAFLTGKGALWAMSLDGKITMEVAAENVQSAAWSADGRSLFHVVRAMGNPAGEIQTRAVVSVAGELLQDAPQAETLAVAAFQSDVPPKLAVLPDGRLLFSSMPVSVPARASAIKTASKFFLLDPAKPDAAPHAVEIKSGSLPDDLNAFAVSPDGRLVAVVESSTDAVAMLELATGRVEVISPAHSGWKSRLIPAWRNNRELTFAALPSPTALRPELMLGQSGSPPRVLSRDWPEPVVKAWLEAAASDNTPPK